jgi:hypothetical protein
MVSVVLVHGHLTSSLWAQDQAEHNDGKHMVSEFTSSQEAETSRGQRLDTTFKDAPLATYFLQPGPTS